MSLFNLDRLFAPRSVALIGASKKPSSVGAVLARNLLRAGFEGPVMPVHPEHEAIEGVLAYRDVASLPRTPDLAVISTPPDAVPGLVAELAARGTSAAVIVTAGFAELPGRKGAALQRKILSAARGAGMRLVGPNTVGVQVPALGLNASFAHLPALPGSLAFVTQSGGVLTAVLDWATHRNIGFSHLVSLGGMADVDFGDMLDYLANDPHTSAILLYVEAVTHARKFMSAARAAARSKPVIVVKAGRHAEGARAAASHSGALAGSDAVHDAAFQRAGMLRVKSLEELFMAVETLATMRPPRGDGLAILTNGGGMGVLATDALVDEGGRLAELGAASLERLDGLLPSTWSRANPVDLIGDAGPERYAEPLEVLLADEGVDAVLVVNIPTAVSSSTEAARVVTEVARRHPSGRVLASWVGEQAVAGGREIFASHGIPSYDTAERAVQAFMHLVHYRRNQELLTETPPSIPDDPPPDAERARALIETALSEEREWLTEIEAKELIESYGIPVVPTRHAATPAAAAEMAKHMTGPFALKILSPDVLHKTDVGGVQLGVTRARVRKAAEELVARVKRACPEARIEGVSLQPMVRRKAAHELLVGAAEDPSFGPVVIFGHGGTAAELLADRALGLPPLNLKLAHDILSRTRVRRLLEGHRGARGVRLDDVALALVHLSQLLIDHPEIVELDVNPLLADASGIIALDARARVRRHDGRDRLAIRPYPKELEEAIELGDGRKLLLRPIRPEDEPALQAIFARLSPEEVRLRFFVPMKAMSHVMAARFTQLDYDREMALALADPGTPGQATIHGVVRLTADADNERAEYAVLVHREMTGMGLGIVLMRRIIEYARGRGIGEIWGDVLQDNHTMLALCRALGFEESWDPDDPGIVRVTLRLRRRRARPRAAGGASRGSARGRSS